MWSHDIVVRCSVIASLDYFPNNIYRVVTGSVPLVGYT